MIIPFVLTVWKYIFATKLKLLIIYMKRLFIALFAIMTFIACNNSPDDVAQSGYEVNGVISGFDSSYVYLQKVIDGSLSAVDSVLCTNGKFVFKGEVNFPEMYYLNFGSRKFHTNLFIENSKIVVEANYDSLENLTITGSRSHAEFEQYQDEVLPFDNKIKDLYKQYEEASNDENKSLMTQIESTMEVLSIDKKNFVKNYVGNHKKSVVSPYILRRVAYSLEVEELDSMVNILDTSLRASVYYKSMNSKVAALRNVAIGKSAPDFTLNDTTETPISLSSFKGKYLLVDFWASWCGDCRRENPNVVKLYEDYKDKGLEILGVSFDKKKDAWIKGIKDDGLTWPQVSDLKGWGSGAGKLYGVSSIPHTVLLDKDGVIIAKNLMGEELRKKIAELFD